MTTSGKILHRPDSPPLGAPLRRWFGPLRVESDAMLHFDLLRFVAAAGVVWHHSHEFFVASAQRPAVTSRSQALALFVDLFFVISGYVIAFVYARRVTDAASYGRFLQRRVGRLVPLHWLTLAASFALWTAVARAGGAAVHMPDRSAPCVAQAVFLLNGFYTCGNGIVLNGVTWSISAEMALYVTFPLLLLVLRRRWLPVLFALAFAGACRAMPDGRWDHVYAPLRALPSFAFGMLLFAGRDRLPALSRSWPVLALAVATVALMTTGAPQLAVLLCVYLLAAAAVMADKPRGAAPLVRHGAALGQLTYGIYMWHSLFVAVVLNAVGDKYLKLNGAPMAALALVCYAAILAWSYLSLRLVETPVRRWIDQL